MNTDEVSEQDLPVIELPEPERIEVDWRRLWSGYCMIPQGDIDAAYSASSWPKLKTFKHAAKLYTVGSICSGAGPTEAGCYQLFNPQDYTGRTYAVRYTYEGRVGLWKNKQYRLGPEVRFVASNPTVEEWQMILRNEYAYGGYHATVAGTYFYWLHQQASNTNSHQNELDAIGRELYAICAMTKPPVSQRELRELLDPSLAEAEAAPTFTAQQFEMQL